MATSSTDSPHEKEIREQVLRIFKSSRFQHSPRARDFLGYVVDETLRGNGADLSQHSIAKKALGRRGDFYPHEDPAVRMQATRVRRALEHYYLTEGSDDAVVISLPKGSYAPVFRNRYREGSAGPDSPSRPSGPVPEDWPTLLLTPFQNLTGRQDLDFLALGLMDDLAVELDHYPGLRVFLNRHLITGEERSLVRQSNLAADFELIGTLSQIGRELRFSVHLLQARSGEQLWADDFHSPQADVDLVTIRSELPQRIAATIADEQGLISLHTGVGSRRVEPDCSGVYEAILMGYHFESTTSPEAFSMAFQALSKAVELACDCASAWTMLSRLWSLYYSHELSGKPEGIKEAIECGRKAVDLSPRDVNTRVSLAYALLLGDQIEESRQEADLALELNPHTLFFLDAVGYVLTLSGDWDRGPELSRRAIRLNPCPRPVVHSGLWLDAMRREDYETALFEAEQFTTEGTFWRPLMRLTARVLAGEGSNPMVAKEADEILKWKPDFGVNGRRLIQRYVKFPDLQDRIEEGLRGAGIALNGHPKKSPASI